MPNLNTNSNGYTLGFLAIMVVVVGGALALVSSALKPTIDANILLDTRTKIMKSLLALSEEDENSKLTANFVNGEYENNVKAYLVDYNGDVAEEKIPATYDFRKEMKDASKPLENKLFPVYEYTSEGQKVYALQMLGLGLWDEINGYIALKEDKKTIKGVAFDHKGETPGLGAELVKYKFRKQFFNQSLFDTNGNYDFVVYKAGKLPANGKGVDGLAGATLTTNGIDAMVKHTAEIYKNFLNK
ncbi:MAG: NADH:ubiquinone reductase (Na(+)-transporting) subunit C [Chitinophagales bacterium]